MSSKQPSASWNDAQVESLIDLCVTQRSEGHFNDGSGFKPAALNKLTADFNNKNNTMYISSQLSSKLSELKTKFKCFHSLCNNSGFGWDHENEIPTAPDDVWERYLAVNKDAKPYRTKTLQNYAKLEMIFEGKFATGKFSSSSSITNSPRIISSTKSVDVSGFSTNEDDEDDIK